MATVRRFQSTRAPSTNASAKSQEAHQGGVEDGVDCVRLSGERRYFRDGEAATAAAVDSRVDARVSKNQTSQAGAVHR